MIKRILIIILVLTVVPFELYSNEAASGQARKLYEEALIMGRANDIKGAMVKLKEAIGLEPGFAAPYHELSLCYRMSGQGQNAVESMQKAVFLAPENYAYHLDLGRIYIEQNIWRGAIDQLNILWDLDFESAKLLEADIVMFKSQKPVFGKIAQDGTFSASLNFGKASGKEKMAYEAFCAGVKNFEDNAMEEAEKKVQEAIALDRTKSLYFLFLARLYADQELYNKSAETLESFLKYSPHDPQVLHMLGGAYAALGENKKAIAAWERIRDIDEIIYLTREKWIEVMKDPHREEAVKGEIAAWKTYRNEKYGFELKYPQNFLTGQKEEEISKISDQSGVFWVGFIEDKWGQGHNPAVYVYVIKTGLSAEEWVKKNYNPVIPGGEPGGYQDIQHVDINGLPALQVRLIAASGSNDSTLIRKDPETLFRIDAHHSSWGNFPQGIFKKMLSTFKFVK